MVGVVKYFWSVKRKLIYYLRNHQNLYYRKEMYRKQNLIFELGIYLNKSVNFGKNINMKTRFACKKKIYAQRCRLLEDPNRVYLPDGR